jgi:hypothetical protein
MAFRAYAEMESRAWYIELGEEDVGHPHVVMLARVHDAFPQAGIR